MKRVFFAVGLLVTLTASSCQVNNRQGETRAVKAAAMYTEFAKEFLQKGDYAAAQSMALRAQTMKDKDTELTLIKARLKYAESRPDLLVQRDINLLKDDLLIAGKLFPDMKEDIQILKGHLALYIRDFDKAKKIYDDVLKKGKNNPFAHFGLGWILMGQRKEEQAAKEFEAGLKNAPENQGALLAMGNISMDKGKYDDALKYYQKLSGLDPLNIEISKDLVRAFYMKKDNNKALKVLDKLIFLAPRDKQVFMWRAEIMASKKHWKDAIRMASRSMALGGSLDTAVLLARAYIETKNFKQAYNVLVGSLKKYNPQDFQLNFLMAITLDNLGQKQLALAKYKALLASISQAGPKVAQQLAGVRKTCEQAISRLGQEVGGTKKVKKNKK